jgi:hypothetical protein
MYVTATQLTKFYFKLIYTNLAQFVELKVFSNPDYYFYYRPLREVIEKRLQNKDIYSQMKFHYEEESIEGHRVYSAMYNSDWMKEVQLFCNRSHNQENLILGYLVSSGISIFS